MVRFQARILSWVKTRYGKLCSGLLGRIGYVGHSGLAAGRGLRRACRVRRPGAALRRSRGDSGQGPQLRGQECPDRRRPGRAVPRLRLSGAAVAGQVRRHLPAGHVDRPAADLEGLPAGGPRGRGRRLRPRGDRQGERSVPLSIGGRGARPGGEGDRPLADRKVSQDVSRPHRDDRLLPAEEHSGQGHRGQAVQLRRKLPAHQLRGGQAGRPGGQRRRAGRLRHDRLAAAGAGQGRGQSRSASKPACRSSVNGRQMSALEIVTRVERDRRAQRRRADRHGREPLCRHEEPRRLRGARA